MKKFKIIKSQVLGIICLLFSLPMVFGVLSITSIEELFTLNTLFFIVEIIFFIYIFAKTIVINKELNKIEWAIAITLILAMLFILVYWYFFFV